MIAISRRAILLGSTSLGAAAAAGVSLVAVDDAGTAARTAAPRAAVGSDAPPITPIPTRATWLPLLASAVRVRGVAGVRSLTLASIGDLANAPAGDENRYSLTFTTPVPVDGIVGFDGVGGASVSLYLSPVTQAQRTTAQAVIDRS